MAIKYTAEIQAARQIVFKDLIEGQTFKSCVNCHNYDTEFEYCQLNRLKPPAEIIVYGCEMHDFDVPF